MARTLRAAGHNVQVQNYIDNTGVQVADVVIGLLEMEKRTPVSVKMMAMEPRFDYFCWDLYAAATTFFAEDKARAAALRGATLRAIEEGRGEEAEVAETVADAIVGFHLRTMARLGIRYDLLARESEILHLHFWDAAFEKLKEAKAIYKAEVGKMAGCWVMPWNDSSRQRRLDGGAQRSGRREFAGQDYCAFERDGDVRRERHRVPALEIWIAGEGFSLCAMEECAGRRDGVGDDVDEGRGGCAAFWQACGGGLQRDRFAAGVFAAGGGGRIEGAGASEPRRSGRSIFRTRLWR